MKEADSDAHADRAEDRGLKDRGHKELFTLSSVDIVVIVQQAFE